jgi:hypothetical protein
MLFQYIAVRFHATFKYEITSYEVYDVFSLGITEQVMLI